jgi:cytochrome c
VFQYCYSCHSVQPDEINLQGPNLHGIVGRRIASQEGFPYSPALRAFAQEEDRWSESLLDRYLTAPYKLVPKTSMAFPGIEAQDERADLIAYLRSKGDHLGESGCQQSGRASSQRQVAPASHLQPWRRWQRVNTNRCRPPDGV